MECLDTNQDPARIFDIIRTGHDFKQYWHKRPATETPGTLDLVIKLQNRLELTRYKPIPEFNIPANDKYISEDWSIEISHNNTPLMSLITREGVPSIELKPIEVPLVISRSSLTGFIEQLETTCTELLNQTEIDHQSQLKRVMDDQTSKLMNFISANTAAAKALSTANTNLATAESTISELKAERETLKATTITLSQANTIPSTGDVAQHQQLIVNLSEERDQLQTTVALLQKTLLEKENAITGLQKRVNDGQSFIADLKRENKELGGTGTPKVITGYTPKAKTNKTLAQQTGTIPQPGPSFTADIIAKRPRMTPPPNQQPQKTTLAPQHGTPLGPPTFSLQEYINSQAMMINKTKELAARAKELDDREAMLSSIEQDYATQDNYAQNYYY